MGCTHTLFAKRYITFSHLTASASVCELIPYAYRFVFKQPWVTSSRLCSSLADSASNFWYGAADGVGNQINTRRGAIAQSTLYMSSSAGSSVLITAAPLGAPPVNTNRACISVIFDKPSSTTTTKLTMSICRPTCCRPC